MVHIKTILLTTLAYFLGCSVLLSSVHAKDIVANTTIGQAVHASVSTKTHMDNISLKAIGDLHNHVDKTALKVFVKTFGDQAVMSRDRELKSLRATVERSFSVIVLEMLLMFRLAFAIAR